ncbi:DCC1-like thiol-disulfide oxidoreductase family protein [Marinobacteraceae bacterium S3BR75-40.1]
MKEIRLLGHLGDSQLRLQDIHGLTDAQLPENASREALLKRLHLRNAKGHWSIGVEATVVAWSHTRWGWLFRPLLWPVIHPLVNRVYVRWADRRYCGRYACRVDKG